MPNSARTVLATAEIGFHSAKARSGPGSVCAETNTFATNDTDQLLDAERIDFGPRFTPSKRGSVHTELPMDAERLVELFRSRSYYLVSPPDEQARFDRVEAVNFQKRMLRLLNKRINDRAGGK